MYVNMAWVQVVTVLYELSSNQNNVGTFYMQNRYYVTAMALFINGSFLTFNQDTLRQRYFVLQKYIVTNMFDSYRYWQCLQYGYDNDDDVDDDCVGIDDEDDDDSHHHCRRQHYHHHHHHHIFIIIIALLWFSECHMIGQCC